jgi:small subunit ribosomal protein S11
MAKEEPVKEKIEKEIKEKVKEIPNDTPKTVKEAREDVKKTQEKAEEIEEKEEELEKTEAELKGKLKPKETLGVLGKEKPKEEKKKKEERIGMLNIYTSFNNTIMNLTDLSGNSIAKYSGGQSTKQNRLKANPTIAMFIAQKIAEEAKDNGITGFYVKIRSKTGQNNPGPGAHAAIKSLTRAGFKILSIMDTTKVPRGGPKKKGGRRGRRV